MFLIKSPLYYFHSITFYIFCVNVNEQEFFISVFQNGTNASKIRCGQQLILSGIFNEKILVKKKKIQVN